MRRRRMRRTGLSPLFLSELSLCKITFSLISNLLVFRRTNSQKDFLKLQLRWCAAASSYPSCPNWNDLPVWMWVKAASEFSLKSNNHRNKTPRKTLYVVSQLQDTSWTKHHLSGGRSDGIRAIQTLTDTNKDLTDLRSELSDRLSLINLTNSTKELGLDVVWPLIQRWVVAAERRK